MRTTTSFLGLTLLLVAPLSAQQSILLTPQTLAGWNITGTDAAKLSQQAELALPAGAQLARTFAYGDLALKVSTAPTIGQNPEDWPVLELGSAALVFSRTHSVGKWVLVLGDEAPLELPFTFPLDAAGQTGEALEVVLQRAGSTISLAVAGQTIAIPSAMAAGDPTSVVISSGSAHPWDFKSVQLTTGTNGSLNLESADAGQSREKTDKVPAVPAGGMGAALGVGESASNYESATDDPADKSVSAPAGASVTLEIFTPPSVRYGRADAVRRTAARLNK